MVKVYIQDENASYTVQDLLEIMRILRGEGGCPWDREQTHTSIRNNLLEEAYEAVDAIDRLDDTDMAEELGDLLLQIVFHAQMASERGGFDFDTVADGICKKLIYRHPHIFADTKADTADEVLNNWDKLKRKEKHMESFSETLAAVPKAFPACARAQKVQKRAAKAGYDFKSAKEAVSKLEEELGELKQALAAGENDHAAEELGDLLFSAVNTARLLKTDAEEQLSRATEKFICRFGTAEELAAKDNRRLDELSEDELDLLWQTAKQKKSVMLSNRIFLLK